VAVAAVVVRECQSRRPPGDHARGHRQQLLCQQKPEVVLLLKELPTLAAASLLQTFPAVSICQLKVLLLLLSKTTRRW
jgi:hypothetical protein